MSAEGYLQGATAHARAPALPPATGISALFANLGVQVQAQGHTLQTFVFKPLTIHLSPPLQRLHTVQQSPC